jgi:hypothetical protein
LVGLTITGKSYNPDTYEISLDDVEGKVISSGLSSFRFWSPNNNDWVSLQVGFYYCSFWNGTGFDSSNVIAIPGFLISTIRNGVEDTSISSYITGYTFIFSSELPYAIKDVAISNAVIVTKTVFPIAYFKDAAKSQFDTSDFFICYSLSSTNPITINKNSVKFMDPIRCTYIDPTYTVPSVNSTASSTSVVSDTSGITFIANELGIPATREEEVTVFIRDLEA